METFSFSSSNNIVPECEIVKIQESRIDNIKFCLFLIIEFQLQKTKIQVSISRAIFKWGQSEVQLAALRVSMSTYQVLIYV